jgi:hypothetical protein
VSSPWSSGTIVAVFAKALPLRAATATAVMQLFEQGKVRFDDPVQQYLQQ